MKKILAVAQLDFKRVWFGVAALGIVAGILPTLGSFFAKPGSMAAVASGFLAAAVGGAAAIAGLTFGGDFAEGKPSFFFARPLPTTTLLSGRISAAIALCLIAAIGFTLTFGFTGRVPLAGVFREISWGALALLPVIWIGSVFLALAHAISTRQIAKRTWRGVAEQSVRAAIGVVIATIMLVLFFDLFLRALNSRTAIVLFGASWALAAFVAICVAIDRGRTDRLRIGHLLSITMYAHGVLACIVVAITWACILHPPPSSLRDVTGVFGSPDGRVAYVAGHVDRGSPDFQPFYTVNLDSGDVERLPAEWENNWRPWLWHSQDGATKVWTERTPLLFGLARRALTGASTFRFQASFGEPKPLRLPDELEFDTNFPLSQRPEILPASGSDLVAVLWNYRGRGQKIAFVSPSRGQVSQIDLGALRRSITAWTFWSSGHVRAASPLGLGPDRRMQIVDIDPATGALSVLTDQIAGTAPRIRFNAAADRAMVSAGSAAARSLSILVLGDTDATPGDTLVTGPDNNVEEAFMADGSVAVIVRQPPMSELQVFSRDGKRVFTLPLGVGFSRIGNQPFPNTLTVMTNRGGQRLLLFVDTTTGAIVRQIEGFAVPQTISARFWSETPPPPGTPGARLLVSYDKRLVMLPSLSEEPRQLLPRP